MVVARWQTSPTAGSSSRFALLKSHWKRRCCLARRTKRSAPVPTPAAHRRDIPPGRLSDVGEPLAARLALRPVVQSRRPRRHGPPHWRCFARGSRASTPSADVPHCVVVVDHPNRGGDRPGRVPRPPSPPRAHARQNHPCRRPGVQQVRGDVWRRQRPPPGLHHEGTAPCRGSGSWDVQVRHPQDGPAPVHARW